ncbi:MAG: Npt1/Npt2 family nucleotide transporter [Acidobacteria bacterium]|nr:Npt1/Npt2 family nucleotide transporter [Acidobacteriota bacterium]
MVPNNSTTASPLDRFLRVFADVRPGEGLTALLLAVSVFLLLTAYYVLKPVREALILGQDSAELKSYMSAGMVVVLAVVVPLYGRLASRVPRRRLINVVTAIFAACLVLFYALMQLDVSIGRVFFVWIGVFNMMIVAQFWGFANDLYTRDEGERLFAIVGFGASLGAVLGAVIAGWLIAPLGLDQLLLVGAGLLVAQAGLTNYVDTRESARDRVRADIGGRATTEAKTSKTGAGAFGLVFGTPYLLLLGIMLLCLNWVNTTGEYILGSVIEDVARASVAAGSAAGLTVEEYIGQFYSQFFSVVNVVSLLIQLFLVSRLIKYLGVRFGVMALPVIALGAYNVLAFFPVLAAVRWAKTAENATDYSLNNTVRNMLFLPCTRAQKYSGKQVIDSFFVRIGDVLSAALVFIGTTYFALGGSGFAVVNIVIVLVWLVLAFIIGREYKQLTTVGEAPGSTLIGAGK